MEIEKQFDIDAAPADVWAVMIDVEHWPEWTPSVTRIELLDAAPLRVGSRARIRQPRMPVALWTVTRLEPGCSFDWESVVPGLRSRGGHRVEAGPGGRSRVTLTFDWSGWLAPLLRLAAGGIARRFVRAEAEGLKRRCEHDFTEGSGIDARKA